MVAFFVGIKQLPDLFDHNKHKLFQIRDSMIVSDKCTEIIVSQWIAFHANACKHRSSTSVHCGFLFLQFHPD